MIFLLILPGLYILFVLFCTITWYRIPCTKPGKMMEAPLFFSVLIPFRNEQHSIGGLIASLDTLDYPDDQFEVLFVNDHSSDKGPSLVESACARHRNWNMIHLEGGTGKKAALSLGISRARFAIIVTTDADCQVPTGWLKSYATVYQDRQAQFVAGSVELTYKDQTLPVMFQCFEQTALTGITGVTMFCGIPTMCNGANLSFRKEAFNAVNGYQGNADIPSGDDQFLLKKISNKYPTEVFFLKGPETQVQTGTMESWEAMLQQRIRWAGKWKSTGGVVSLMAVFIGVTYASLLLSLIMLAYSPMYEFVLTVLVAKLVMDAIFVRVVSGKGLSFRSLTFWPIIQVIYPFYTLYVAWKSVRGDYIWKGRRYSSAV